MCGEKRRPALDVRAVPGSPPRVRGKGHALRLRLQPPGITPACAGKRRMDGGSYAKAEDHPRVCGEKPLLFFVLSPP